MEVTTYTETKIEQLRAKYKWHRWCYNLIHFILFLIIYTIKYFIDIWCNYSYGYYDNSNSYNYICGTNYFIHIILIFIGLFIILSISLLIPKLMKERYIEFEVARRNDNFPKYKWGWLFKIIFIIIFTIFLIISAMNSYNNLTRIKLSEEDFYIKHNIKYYVVTDKTYDYNYFDSIELREHKYTNTICFQDNKAPDKFLIVDIGKDSQYQYHLLKMLDEKTGNKYHLLENLTKINENKEQ